MYKKYIKYRIYSVKTNSSTLYKKSEKSFLSPQNRNSRTLYKALFYINLLLIFTKTEISYIYP